jgi:hypothetical protein
MIISREIEIKVNSTNIGYLHNLGYEVKGGELLSIPIELLSPGSHYKISCKCDKCGIIKDILFKNYIKYGNKWGEYFCRKCSEDKRKKSLQLSHGVDYPIQNKEIRNKIKKSS